VSFADTRGAKGLFVAEGVNLRNTILRSGAVRGLNVQSGESFVVRNHAKGLLDVIPINIENEFQSDGIIRMLFDDVDWESTISFRPGIPVELGGTLALSFAADVDPSLQIGRTFKLFDWTGVTPSGRFRVVSQHQWDTANLYSTGEVTLIPEPATWVMAVFSIVLGSACMAVMRRGQ